MFGDSYRATIASIHADSELLLPPDVIRDGFLVPSVQIGVSLYIFLAVSLFLLRNRKGSRRLAFQATNLVVNTILGIAGFAYLVQRQTPWNAPVVERLQGHLDMHWFSAFQLGFQYWSIPIGLWVGEDPIMIGHHVGVVVVSMLSGLFVNGYRFYTPFFFGLIELSTIPWVFVNVLKDQPELASPEFAHKVRLVFAGSFLTVRILLFLPWVSMYLTDLASLLSHGGPLWYCALATFVFTASVAIAGLQLFWGNKVIKALLKAIRGERPKTKTV